MIIVQGKTEFTHILTKPFVTFSTLALMENILKISALADFCLTNIQELAFGQTTRTEKIVENTKWN